MDRHDGLRLWSMDFRDMDFRTLGPITQGTRHGHTAIGLSVDSRDRANFNNPAPRAAITAPVPKVIADHLYDHVLNARFRSQTSPAININTPSTETGWPMRLTARITKVVIHVTV
jgi:hypothetical protein